MAKVKYHETLARVRGGFYRQIYSGLGTDNVVTVTSKNQHATILIRKRKKPAKKTDAQRLLRDRFQQLECMWKLMTPNQRIKWTEYAQELSNSTGKNLKPIQWFRSKGLKYELDEFLLNKCCALYKLAVHKVTEEVVILRVDLTIKPAKLVLPQEVRHLSRLL